MQITELKTQQQKTIEQIIITSTRTKLHNQKFPTNVTFALLVVDVIKKKTTIVNKKVSKNILTYDT